MSNDIDEKIRSLNSVIEDVWAGNADAGNVLSDVQDELMEIICMVKGEHDFIFDMCGYWQHQYCAVCNAPKFPRLARKNCSELSAEMGATTEAQYQEARQ